MFYITHLAIKGLIYPIHFCNDGLFFSLQFFNLKGEKLQTIPLIGSFLSFVKVSTDFSLCVTVDNIGHIYILEKV